MQNFNTNIIQNYISQNKLSKAAFCKKCNICYSTYVKIMRNNTGISIVALFKISRVLGVNISDLLVQN